MINALIEEFPTAVEIDGEAAPINTDFRTCIRAILAFEAPDLASMEKIAVMLELLYPEKPSNIDAAIAQGLKFLNGGESSDDDDDPGYKLYSFSKDASLIFSAFRQTHGIDLEKEDMHWWKFLALFSDLGADTAFCNLVGLRKRVKTGRATKEERALAREMGDLFDVPEIDARTLEDREKEAEFMRLIGAANE